MSLNWNFKTDFIGTWKEIYQERSFIGRIYKCNGLAVVLHEIDNNYSMHTFFIDEEHLKNCLGITKGYNNIFDESNYILEISLDNSKTSKKILKNLVKAEFKNATVKIIINEKPF